MLNQLLSELRHALRALLSKPGFTWVAVVTLALGIGANTAVYSIFEQIVTRPLPVPSPQELVNLSAPGPKRGSTSNNSAGPRDAIFSYPMWRDLREQQSVFTGIAAHRSLSINLAFQGQTQAGDAMLVSPEYFSVLQVQPALGRLLNADDDLGIGEPRIAVLSHRYWMQQLGGAPEVINQTLRVNGEALTVVGVAPEGFEGTTIGTRPQVFVPLSLRWLLTPGAMDDHDNRLSYWVYLFARLKPGVNQESAQQEMQLVHTRVLNEVEAPLQQGMDAAMLAEFNAKPLLLEPGARGQSSLSTNAATPIMLLLAVATLVLLVACMNVANLLLARASTRAGEMAVRASIGASDAQLLRQQLIESLLLAVLGALVSIPVALLCLKGLLSAMPANASQVVSGGLDASALRYAILVALSTILIFGLFPAWQASRAEPMRALKSAATGSGGSRIAARFRAVLATLQIACSMTSLVLAGLFIQSLNNLSQVELGMQVDALATFEIAPGRNGYSRERSAAIFDELEEKLAALPGVSAVTTSMVPLLSGSNWGTNISVEGYSASDPDEANALYNEVGKDFLRTLDIRLLAGRDFSAADGLDRPGVAIVNRRFAEHFGLGDEVIGKRMAIGAHEQLDIEIVGLIEDTHYDSVKSEAPVQFLLPRRQNLAHRSMFFYVRSQQAPEYLLTTLPKVVAAVDPDLPIENLSTLRQEIRRNLVVEHFVGMLSSAFAVLATLLAAIGVYGALSYTLSQRTREIGLRLALGAAPRQVLLSQLKLVAHMFAIGGGIGLVLALGLGHAARSLLFGLSGTDPWVLTGATLILAAIALFAGWWPARRAARVDPLVALRWE
jgi:putative ABC transport system permease protein